MYPCVCNSVQKYLYAVYDIVDEVAPLPLGALSAEFDFIDRLRRALQEILPDDAHVKVMGTHQTSQDSTSNSQGDGR